MEATINQIQEIVSILTSDEQQLLKDTINYGAWGDSDWEFLDDNEKVETVTMYGYCTNDAKRAGHFSGRKVSSMFRSMYKKLCPANHNQIGDTFHIVMIGGAMVAAICSSSEKATIMPLRNGHGKSK